MAESFDIVIFGGTGDLSMRKLIPALFRAYREDQLSPDTRIIASCRSQESVDNYLETAGLALQQHLADGEFDAQASSLRLTCIR